MESEQVVNATKETRDEALIRAHLNGSDTAFDRLVESHAPRLASALERMVRDHHLALDIAQEVFIKVHGMLPRYRFEGRFRSMLYSVALNHARDKLREQKRSRIVYLEEAVAREDRALAHDPTEDRDRRALIEDALDRVPSPFQEAVYLRDVVGLSYDETAASLGCSPGTVKSRVNRGRLSFRDHYLDMADTGERRSKGG